MNYLKAYSNEIVSHNLWEVNDESLQERKYYPLRIQILFLYLSYTYGSKIV